MASRTLRNCRCDGMTAGCVVHPGSDDGGRDWRTQAVASCLEEVTRSGWIEARRSLASAGVLGRPLRLLRLRTLEFINVELECVGDKYAISC